MLPYIILLIFSGIFGFLLCESKSSPKKELLVLGVMTLLMCVMAALRSGSVGIDYDWVYRDYFLAVREHSFSYMFSADNLYRVEPLYGLLNQVVALFTGNPLVLWWTASVIIILLRAFFIWKYSSKIWLSIFCYIGLGFFTYALCTLRQELGISVAMFALPFLQKRKPLQYFLIIALAGLCHTSLFVLIPVYFIATIPPNKWMISLYSTCFFIVVFFSEIILQWIIQFVPRFAQYTPDSYYMRGRNINTVIIWIIILLIASLLYKKLLERDKNNLVLFNLFLYGTLIMSLTVKHFVFQRVALIFLPFSIMLIPEIVQCLLPTSNLQDMIDGAKNNKLNGQQLAALKRQQKDSIRMYYSIMGLLIMLVILEYLFLLYANRLLLVPYIPFWM
ncbi:MAG: putative polysaccharide polymerase [Oscillospiraceae bacterium]|nr:putative polysaccharide polymerase [Oscillospiraceae bacterium]